MKNHKIQKGFTLIELLIVIAIIAILAVVVVLTLNPAQLLAQARDSTRISDFATLKSALSLYATDVVTSTSMGGVNSSSTIWTSTSTSINTTTNGGTASSTWGFVGGETAVSSSVSRTVGGTGWIPVNLNAISSGAPISVYPVDPVNNASTTYAYVGALNTYKLATKMESTKYGLGGSNDVVSTDGGYSSSTYEQGTNLSL